MRISKTVVLIFCLCVVPVANTNNQSVVLECGPFHVGLEKLHNEFANRGYKKQQDVLVSVFDAEGELHIYTDTEKRAARAVLVLPGGCTFNYMLVDQFGQ